MLLWINFLKFLLRRLEDFCSELRGTFRLLAVLFSLSLLYSVSGLFGVESCDEPVSL